MGKASRDKGAAWEREVAKMLRAAGVPAKRGLGQARSASEVADVQVEGFWVECKVGGPARYPLKALEQANDALTAASAGGPITRAPVAICKPDHKKPTATFATWVCDHWVAVTISLRDWIRIVAAEHKAREVREPAAPQIPARCEHGGRHQWCDTGDGRRCAKCKIEDPYEFGARKAQGGGT